MKLIVKSTKDLLGHSKWRRKQLTKKEILSKLGPNMAPFAQTYIKTINSSIDQNINFLAKQKVVSSKLIALLEKEKFRWKTLAGLLANTDSINDLIRAIIVQMEDAFDKEVELTSNLKKQMAA